MKYLSDYVNDKTSEVLNRMGAFWAFSDKQFKEQKKEGIKYIDLGAGMVCDEKNAEQLVNEMEKVVKDGIAQDISDNGTQGIIIRELANHEAYYTGTIEQTAKALDGYNIDIEDILKIFKREQQKTPSLYN